MPHYLSNTMSAPDRRAFTLIEVLVVIGIIGVLIAIVVPSLSSARAAGGETVTRSNMKQLGATMENYIQVYDQTYPYAPPGAFLFLTPPEERDDGSSGAIVPYWNLDAYWVALMHDIAPWREHYRTWIGPGGIADEHDPWKDEDGFRFPSYRLSHTFFARPELWAPATQDDPSFYRPVHAQDVLYPASKVMMWDAELTHLASNPKADRDMRSMLFGDGHVEGRRLSVAATPPTIPFKQTKPVQDTPDGVHGRDY